MAFTLNPASILGPEFYGFLLPWIFTFAIVYGLLMKLKLFDKSQVNVALSFVIAFFVTGAAGPQMAAFFINLFGGASMYLAGILVLLLFMGLMGFKPEEKFKNGIYLVAVIIIAIALFLGSTGMFVGHVVIGSDIATLAFWLIIIALAIYMITGKDKDGGGPAK
jgi:hypothetical protein